MTKDTLKPGFKGRRLFLGAAAALPATSVLGAKQPQGAAGSGPLATSVLDAKHSQQDPQRGKHRFDADVIVIGAGFAGVTAARELGVEGHKVILLEASTRLGGRTYSGRFAGQDVEFGGAWVHWAEPHIWAEVQRYGHGVEEEQIANVDRALVMLSDGRVKQVTTEELAAYDRSGMDKFCAGARELFPRPYEPMANPKVRELENISAAEHIATLGLNEIQTAMLNAEMTLYGAGSTKEYSYMAFVKCFSCMSWDYYTFNDADRRYRIGKGGTLGLLKSMIKHSKAEVRFSSAVNQVRQERDHVIVTTEDGRKVTARAVVVTVPTNTYKRIQFIPELAAAKRKYIDQGEMGDGAKVFVQLEKNHGNTFAFCDDPNPLTVVQTIANNDEIGTILSLTPGRRKLIDINDADEVEKQVQRLFPKAKLTGLSGYDWPNDPYAKQGWGSYRVGQMSLAQEMAVPDGRVFLAGASTAGGLNEYIDGAVESGLRAGRQVREMFGRSSS
ncbi:FAD-dependent oxidoreductase [Massilia sp. CT11-137]|uniref:flavin monoamine oxidase family protein n=1 Tax=Massilia sp. CT11-137 TaxID=3393901 RepID=UPI0039AEE2F0